MANKRIKCISCKWCFESFKPTRKGQVFCSAGHRSYFNNLTSLLRTYDRACSGKKKPRARAEV